MNQKTLTILIFLSFFTSLLWGADLRITWREGRDNRYNYPARLVVTNADNGNPVANAEVYRDKELLGKTDQKGQLTSTTLNGAAVKYSLKACKEGDCSNITAYSVLHSEFPFPAFISVGADPGNSMSFTWHTEEQVKVTMVECIRQDDPLGFSGKQVVRTRGLAYVNEIIDLDKPEGIKQRVMIHKATVNQLSPDTRYLYRIGDGRHWSEGSFTTAAGPGNDSELKFLFIADTQESTRENYQVNAKNILAKAFEKNPDIRFIVQGGDFVNRGMNGQEWSWAYEAGETYFRNMALAAVVGNHETGGITSTAPQQRSQAYLSYSNNPSNHTSVFAEGSAYSFNYGTVHLLCLDLQNLDDAIEINSKTGEKKYLQAAIEWITKDLATATAQKKWKVVVMHQPIYGANRDEKEFREVLAPLFDKGKADVVISGHDHYYFRSFPMRYDSLKNDGEVVPIDQFGTVYLIGGTSCSKLYVQKFAKPYQAVVMAKANFPGRYPFLRTEPLTKPTYSTFTVSKEKLHYQFFDMDGKLLDEFSLGKKTE
jgi:hypothetical protein